MKRIVVGVDASPPSIEALGRAAEEARLRGAKLEVVYVFPPPAPVAAFPVPVDRGSDRVDVERERGKAKEQLGKWLQDIDVDLAGIDVEWTVEADVRPAHPLVVRSREADLVVVGSRGRGGFAGLRMGSVSEQVTRYAHCPVLVVRDRSRRG